MQLYYFKTTQLVVDGKTREIWTNLIFQKVSHSNEEEEWGTIHTFTYFGEEN